MGEGGLVCACYGNRWGPGSLTQLWIPFTHHQSLRAFCILNRAGGVREGFECTSEGKGLAPRVKCVHSNIDMPLRLREATLVCL